MRLFLSAAILLGLAACVHSETVKETPARATVVTPAAPNATVIQTP